jgi:hypothetical protein
MQHGWQGLPQVALEMGKSQIWDIGAKQYYECVRGIKAAKIAWPARAFDESRVLQSRQKKASGRCPPC